ncbi:hypothetical protein [Actinomycetospora flava]|uniref:Uncharacterized protein n=1 Tax=Actinomycetospora flava TaxID=3129232 RepID=A0ABU8MF48_9PSEU
MRTKSEARSNEAFKAAMRGSVNQMASRLCAAARQKGTALGEPESVRRHLRRIQSGAVAVPSEPYLSLICEDTGHSALHLFGVLDDAPTGPGLRSTFAVTSHQFVTTFLGADGAAAVAGASEAEPAEVAGVPCARVQVRPGAELYLFDVGTAIFHVVEQVQFAYIAELARWRRRSYTDVLAWASEWLTRAAGHDVEAGYVFSVYWLDRSRWPAEQLPIAVKLLSVPKIVLGEAGDLCGNAEAVEERLLREGDLEDDRIKSYGFPGVSYGFASWSAVAYCPLLDARALDPQTHVDTELLTQSVWAFCRHVLDQVEAGDDPDIDEAEARRYLRAMRSRASSPRAQESGQSVAMRRAVFATSDLEAMITGALDCLR